MLQNLFWPPFLNRIFFFFKFFFKKVKISMFSYLESKFTEKIPSEKCFFFLSFSNFAHVTIFAKTKIRFLAAILKQYIF